MRILMVSPYPPIRDGIGAYAVQVVAALRKEGHDVEVLSPAPSAAHHCLDLLTPAGLAGLARIARGFDKVVVQFHPDIFYGVATDRRHASVSRALRRALRAAGSSEVFVHEIDYRDGRRPGLAGFFARRLWRGVDRVLVHTEVERRDFVAAFGVAPGRVVVTAHGAHFIRRTRMTPASARRSLGIPEDQVVFLAIGFIQAHKGFDRAVSAFAGLDVLGAALHVVGSVRVDEPDYLAYRDELAEQIARTPGAHLHDQYVSDELFDRWLVASDVVVLPYRNIWSSGVLERAMLYERRVIAMAVGGLSHQVGERRGVTLVDESGLAEAMRRARQELGAVAGAPRVEGGGWPLEGERLRARVQEEIVARAERLRGPLVAGREGGGRGLRDPAASGQPLRRLPPLAIPEPRSSRLGFALLKRLVRATTAFEVDPVVDHVNALREATIRALEQRRRPDYDGDEPARPE